MHATSTAETDIGDYRNEYMLVLHMTEDGGKVERFMEYVDSGYSREFLGRLRAYVERKGDVVG